MTHSVGGFVGGLASEEASHLIALGHRRLYPPRSTLFLEGDEAHEVLIVTAGDVKITITTSDGREVVLDVVGPGEILGELSAVDAAPRSATACALNRVEVVAIDLGRFGSFLDEHPTVAVALLRCIATRLRSTTRRQVEFGTVDALGRVCGRIVEMSDRYGETCGEAVTIPALLSQSEVGGWAGLSREAVVKALAALRTLGWISNRGRAITVVDAPALRARAKATLA